MAAAAPRGRGASRLLDLARGLLALAVLAGLLGGVPLGLLAVADPALPATWPTLDDATHALTQPDDGSVFLGALAVLGWAAWAAFAVLVTVEATARLRGLPAPRLPGLAAPQRAAAGLVAAVALLLTSSVAAPALAAASSAQGAPRPASARVPVTAAATAAPDPGPHSSGDSAAPAPGRSTGPAAAGAAATAHPPGEAHAASAPAPAAAGTHTVRGGETLWSIAAEHLGDGARWQQVAALNYGRLQPDGAALTDAHWLRPGWRLLLPAPTPAHSPDAHPGRAARAYVVRPGDTLSQIAHDDLGDATRWPQIAAGSTSTQTDGTHLDDPNLIRPGWHLSLPGTPQPPPAAAAAEPTPEPPRAHPMPPPAPRDSAHAVRPGAQLPAARPPVPPTASSAGVAAPGPSATSPAAVPPIAAPAPPAAPTTQAGAPSAATSDITAAVPADPGAPEEAEPGVPLRTTAGVGALLAAALLALVGAGRSRQRRRRGYRQQVPLPAGEAAHTEVELRRVADVDPDLLDRALRALAAGGRQAGALPGLRLVRVTADGVEVTMAEPRELPAPLQATADPAVWTMPRDTEPVDPEPVDPEPVDPEPVGQDGAPYPALVSLGQDLDGAHLLVDLEHTAVLTIAGSAEQTLSVLAAVAVELGTSRWADGVALTLVGCLDELPAALGNGRARWLPAAQPLLEELAARTRHAAHVLHATHVDGLHAARLRADAQGHWPTDVVLAHNPDPQVRQQLAALAEAAAGTGLAAVVTTDATPPTGERVLRLHDDRPDLLEDLGLSLHAQRLPAAAYRDLLTLLSTAQAPLVPAPADTFGGDDSGVSHPAAQRAAPGAGTPGATGVTPVDGPALVLVPARPNNSDAPSDAAAPAGPAAAHPDRGADVVVEDVAVRPAAPPAVDLTAAEVPGCVAVEAREVLSLPAPPGPVLRVLGPLDVQGAGGEVEPTKRGQLTEVLCWLALHPGLDHRAFDAAIYPMAGAVTNTRNTALSKLRRWLGRTPDGEPFVPLVREGGYRLHPDVGSDWQHWQQLVGPDPRRAGTEELRAALSLVRGQPFAGTPPHRYAWAEPDRLAMIEAVGDAAHELAQRGLEQRDPAVARFAAAAGMQTDPGSELLWRDALRAEALAGNRPELDRLTRRLLSLVEDIGEELDPDTVALLEQLAPRPVGAAS